MRIVEGIVRSVNDALVRALVFPIKVYRIVHPYFFRGVCRFYPTCSEYAIEAFRLHGPFKGFYLAVFRILRCNPFCKGGYDPVPLPKRKKI